MATPAILQEQPVAPEGRVAARRGGEHLWVHVFLFVVTLLTTTMVGMRYMDNFQHGLFPLASDEDILPLKWVAAHAGRWAMGLPFSLTLLGILLVHEFAHYAACRIYGIRATLPYLIPAPSLSGTAGAIIKLKSRVTSRAALMAIGASGPIAGFVVALGTTWLGLRWSVPVPVEPTRLVHLHEPMLIALMRHGSHGPLLWHPMLVASWIGLLVTSLNLVPAGQLDGGHILYSLSPRVHRVVTNVAIGVLAVLGIFSWMGWLLWVVLLLIPGMRHPKVKDDTPLTMGMVWLAPVCLGIFLLTATPQPFAGASAFHLLRWFRF